MLSHFLTIRKGFQGLLTLTIGIILSGCGELYTTTSTPTPVPSATPVPTATLPPVTATATATASPSLPMVQPAAICSPLKNIPTTDLVNIVSNPYEAPLPGSDAGHHGVDFGFYRYGPYDVMASVPIQSMLSGTVAGVLPDRRPYGNAILIETALEDLPPSWQALLQTVAQPQLIPLDGRLNCPDILTPTTQAEGKLSLYVLYAHMQSPTELEIGDSVVCGAEIGAVGTTGASINDHLHLEMRLGYSGARFDHMAHYINNATQAEMDQYCTWRISGWYGLLDPLTLITLPETNP